MLQVSSPQLCAAQRRHERANLYSASHKQTRVGCQAVKCKGKRAKSVRRKRCWWVLGVLDTFTPAPQQQTITSVRTSCKQGGCRSCVSVPSSLYSVKVATICPLHSYIAHRHGKGSLVLGNEAHHQNRAPQPHPPKWPSTVHCSMRSCLPSG
jgi:hypothetical protein